MLQDAWKINVGWDAELRLPIKLQEQWKTWIADSRRVEEAFPPIDEFRVLAAWWLPDFCGTMSGNGYPSLPKSGGGEDSTLATSRRDNLPVPDSTNETEVFGVLESQKFQGF